MPELHTRLLADVIALGSPYPLVLTVIRRNSKASSSSSRENGSDPSPGFCGRWTTTVPQPLPRCVSTKPALRNAAIASRRVARDTARRSARIRSVGGAEPRGYPAGPIAVADRSTHDSKAWWERTGRSRPSPGSGSIACPRGPRASRRHSSSRLSRLVMKCLRPPAYHDTSANRPTTATAIGA